MAVYDFTQKKTSAPGLIGEIASLHVIGTMIDLLLWPIWLLCLLLRADD